MANYKMVVAYLGAGYAGWQIQPGRPTIQGELQRALRQITGKETKVVGAGRTDSGVHALHQVAHFRLPRVEPTKLVRSLNAVLPVQVRVKRILAVPDSFHALRDAVKKRYVYRVYNGPVLSPFLQGRVYHFRFHLEAQPMQEAANLLLGKHDFTSFVATGSKVLNRSRTLYRADLIKKGYYWQLRFEANGFLHHMVRNIVGTLLQMGRGRRPEQEIVQILRARDRKQAGPTAPAQGLYLVKIWYR